MERSATMCRGWPVPQNSPTGGCLLLARATRRKLAGLLVHQASDDCEFVTGQTIFLDGVALAHA